MQSVDPEQHPTYKLIGMPEVDNNPLLAHLNLPPGTDDEAFIALGLRPDFQVEDRLLPSIFRRIRINRLRNFFVPAQPVHREALIGIASQVFHGYIQRNPLTPEGQRRLLGAPKEQSYKPTISFIAGHSGMGKSTLVDRILASLGQQVYHHTEFNKQPFPECQILWLRRNVPEHCTVKTLCSSFGDYTDRVLGNTLYERLFTSARRDHRDQLITEIRKIITNHHVGLLVFDEFQNLSLMGVGAEKIIALLVNLRDELGIPILVVGTYSALHLLERNLSTARRLAEGGYYDLQRPTSVANEDWQQLCRIVWPYQWVQNPLDYSEKICDALYEVSQGITGIMLSVFASAQIVAINNGSEQVDANLILNVFNERMKPLHPAIRALKAGNVLELTKFEGLYKSFYPDKELPETASPHLIESPPAIINPPSSNTKKSKRKSSVSRTKVLTPEQIKSRVLDDCASDIVSVLKSK
ncbi:ATP-binding protein [Pseudomonas moorei]|uniref:AAA domain-containing protein n=1 Tax=Pseudomonas moorei TaxID=395599 RepID=A0A1H1I420_9PSED|nr:ATP-binding protein [Pseudomonas moorei]SDR32433.1 AAA domain-containing protein [Pseudomonas moorei]